MSLSNLQRYGVDGDINYTYTPDPNRIYVAALTSSEILEVNPVNGEITNRISVSKFPFKSLLVDKELLTFSLWEYTPSYVFKERKITPWIFFLDLPKIVERNTWYHTNSIIIGGLNTEVIASVPDLYSIQIWKNDQNVGTKTTVKNGDILFLKILTPNSPQEKIEIPLIVGEGYSYLQTTTKSLDSIVKFYDFIDVIDADIDQTYISNPITIFDIDPDITLQAKVTNGTIVKNEIDTGQNQITVSLNDTISIKATSSESYSTPLFCRLEVGIVDSIWTIITQVDPIDENLIPTPINFDTIYDANVNQDYISNQITLLDDIKLYLEPFSNAKLIVNSNVVQTPYDATAGDIISIEGRSSYDYDTNKTVKLFGRGWISEFSIVTRKDTLIDYLTYNTSHYVPLRGQSLSNTIQITGLSDGVFVELELVPINITNQYIFSQVSPKFKKNSIETESQFVTIENGDLLSIIVNVYGQAWNGGIQEFKLYQVERIYDESTGEIVNVNRISEVGSWRYVTAYLNGFYFYEQGQDLNSNIEFIRNRLSLSLMDQEFIKTSLYEHKIPSEYNFIRYTNSILIEDDIYETSISNNKSKLVDKDHFDGVSINKKNNIISIPFDITDYDLTRKPIDTFVGINTLDPLLELHVEDKYFTLLDNLPEKSTKNLSTQIISYLNGIPKDFVVIDGYQGTPILDQSIKHTLEVSYYDNGIKNVIFVDDTIRYPLHATNFKTYEIELNITPSLYTKNSIYFDQEDIEFSIGKRNPKIQDVFEFNRIKYNTHAMDVFYSIASKGNDNYPTLGQWTHSYLNIDFIKHVYADSNYVNSYFNKIENSNSSALDLVFENPISFIGYTLTSEYDLSKNKNINSITSSYQHDARVNSIDVSSSYLLEKESNIYGIDAEYGTGISNRYESIDTSSLLGRKGNLKNVDSLYHKDSSYRITLVSTLYYKRYTHDIFIIVGHTKTTNGTYRLKDSEYSINNKNEFYIDAISEITKAHGIYEFNMQPYYTSKSPAKLYQVDFNKRTYARLMLVNSQYHIDNKVSHDDNSPYVYEEFRSFDSALDAIEYAKALGTILEPKAMVLPNGKWFYYGDSNIQNASCKISYNYPREGYISGG